MSHRVTELAQDVGERGEEIGLEVNQDGMGRRWQRLCQQLELVRWAIRPRRSACSLFCGWSWLAFVCLVRDHIPGCLPLGLTICCSSCWNFIAEGRVSR